MSIVEFQRAIDMQLDKTNKAIARTISYYEAFRNNIKWIVFYIILTVSVVYMFFAMRSLKQFLSIYFGG